jgi:hypothetical protein
MNLAWYARRLRRMSAAEIATRSSDAFIRYRWRRRQVHEMAADPLEVPCDLGFSPTPLHPIDPASIPRKARDSLVRAADELVAGRWRVFDQMRDDMAVAPDWFLDPRTRRHAPRNRYAFAARHLHSWWTQNPFLSGVHWISGIELGIRLIAWVWIRRLLDDWSGARALFEDNEVFIRQLHHHQEYLVSLPSRGSSANNHLIAEMAGQFAACCGFPYFPETPVWRQGAAAVLRRELRRQTFQCGLNRELATGYHGFVLELSLAAGLEGEAAGHSLGSDYWETIRRMSDALAATVDTNLKPPRQGDDARPISTAGALSWRLATPCSAPVSGGRACRRPICAPFSGPSWPTPRTSGGSARNGALRIWPMQAWLFFDTALVPRTRSGAAAIMGPMDTFLSPPTRTPTPSASRFAMVVSKFCQTPGHTPIRAKPSGGLTFARPSHTIASS